MKKADPRDPRTRNFRIEPGARLVPSGATSRLRANLRAIQVLRFIEMEGRLALPSEKAILSAYSGWGALKECLNSTMAQTRELAEWDWRRKESDYLSWEKNWGPAYNEVRGSLLDSEFRAAQASTLNAHYTSPDVAGSMWDIARRLGYSGGRLLEPSCGTGNFFGLMPLDIAASSDVVGVELDPLTARIAALLYPQLRILNTGFEDARIGNGSVALAIGNVPFEQTGPVDSRKPINFNLHNYFFAHTIEKLAPGGVMIYITSAYTMDAKAAPQAQQRKYIAERTEMVGAVRLPSNAFKQSAGTDVVTDIIVLRKPDGVKVLPTDEGWARTVDVEIGGNPHRINEYFARHPEMILGEQQMSRGLYSDNEYTVEAPENLDLRTALAKVVEIFPTGIMGREVIEISEEREKFKHAGDRREFSFHNIDGVIHQVVDATLQPVERFSKAEVSSAKAWIAMRDEYSEMIALEVGGAGDEELDKRRQRLNEIYDQFVAEHGYLNDPKTRIKHMEEDPEYYRIQAIEDVKEKRDEEDRVIGRSYRKTDCFTKRTVTPAVEPTEAESLDDALAISLAWRGRIDVPYIDKLLGGEAGSHEEIEAGLEATGRVLRDPLTGGLARREEVLSGNVRKKFEIAQKAAEDDPERYNAVAEALLAVLPPWMPAETCGVKLGAPWIPSTVVQSFVNDLLASSGITVSYNKHIDMWALEGGNYCRTAEATSTYGTDRMNATEIIARMLNLKDTSVFDTLDLGDGKTVQKYNPTASEMVRQKVEAISRAFRAYCCREDVRGDVEEAFNYKLNNYVAPSWDGTHMAMPGLSEAFTRKDHQLGVVWRMLQERHGVIYHDVGFGKTLSAIMLSREAKRLGAARKPMIVVENATIRQFAESYRRAYPGAKVLVATEATFAKNNRRRFLSSIAANDWDAVIVAHSQFDMIPVRPDRLKDFYEDQLDTLEIALLEAKSAGSRLTQRDIERKKRALKVKLERLADAAEQRQDDAIEWEDLGVDWLVIDECHRYKKPPFTTKLERVKGFSNEESQRALNAMLKLRIVQEKHGGGRGVIGMSGTAITNQMAEAWVQMHLFSPGILEEFGCETFDRFAGSYCEKVTGIELNEATNKFRLETRLAKFINGQILVSMLRSSMDIQMDASKIGLVVPEAERIQTIVPLSPTNKAINQLMAKIYKSYEKSTNKSELSYVPIMLMQVGMAASVDPRLILPDARVDGSETVLGTVADDVFATWKETEDIKGTQLIFADRYRPMNISALTSIASGGATMEIEDGEEEGKQEEETVVSSRSRGGFNLYRALVEALVERGIPPEQIAVVHDHDTQVKKKALFDKVNQGEVRVMIGSTTKMGVGVNVQRRLVTIHKMDAARTMTPADERQRDGRIIRQGNTNESAKIAMYGMQGTTAAGIYDRIARKDKFIAQLLAGNGVGSEFEDPMGSLTFSSAEMKAKIVGDPRVERQVLLTEEVREARVKRDSFYQELSSDRRRLASEEAMVGHKETRAATLARHAAVCADRFNGERWEISGKMPDGTTFEEGGKEECATRIDLIVDDLGEVSKYQAKPSTRVKINGVPCNIYRQAADFGGEKFRYWMEMNDPEGTSGSVMREIEVRSGQGCLMTLRNTADVLAREQERCERDAAINRANVEKLKVKIANAPKEYPGEDELAKLQAELAAIETELLEAEKAEEEQTQQAVSEGEAGWEMGDDDEPLERIEEGMRMASDR